MAESTLPTRFWAKVDRRGPDECWPWTAGRMPRGYGLFTPRGKGSRTYAHRVSYEMHHGPIQSGLHVLHTCDNPPCVNPAHLFLGTAADNAADKVAKGRQRRGEGVPQSVLTAADVRAIRALAGTASSYRVAPAFGVHPRTIRDIWNGKTWASVPASPGAQ